MIGNNSTQKALRIKGAIKIQGDGLGCAFLRCELRPRKRGKLLSLKAWEAS